MRVRPISLEELSSKLEFIYRSQEGNKGTHAVIDTQWSRFLEEFSGLVDVNSLLRGIYSRVSDLDVLDEGCGSSLTLFEAIESIENEANGYRVNGYGLTASLQFLRRGPQDVGEAIFTEMKEAILRNYSEGTPENRRTELLLEGVQENEELGLHRFSPQGNLIRFKKGDLHYLQIIFPEQKFDLIYSSATYPHLLCPWLAFERSVDALREGGILLIDSMPTTEILDIEGNVISPEEYRKLIEDSNPGYNIYFKSSSNPFYAPIVVEKETDRNWNSVLHFGKLEEQTMGERIVGVVNKDKI